MNTNTVNFVINAQGNIQAVATSATTTNQQMTQAAAAANSYANALQRAGKAGKAPPVGGSSAAGNALASTNGVGGGSSPPGGLDRGTAAGNSRGDSRDFARQAQGLGGLVHLYATFAANVFAVSAAFTALKKAEDVTIMFKTMNFLSASVGTNVRALATDLFKLTDAAISLPEAGKFAAMGTAAGMSAVQMRELAEGARAAAQVMGRDAADAMYRLTRAVTKIEPELIDELGILTKAGSAYKAYAAQVGKSADDLTGAQRQQAYSTAVLEELKLKYGELYGVLKANPYAKLMATGQNAMQNFLEVMNKGFGPLAQGFAENIQMVGLFGTAIVASLLKRAIPSLTTFKENAVSKLDAVKKAYEEANNLKLNIGNPATRQALDSAKTNLAQKELDVIQRKEAIGAKLLASAQNLVTQAYKDQNGITAKAITSSTSFTAAQENLKAVQNRIAQVSGMTNRTADDDKRLAALQKLEKLLGTQVDKFKSVQAAISGVTAAQNTLNQANIQAGLIQNKHVERLAGQIKRQEKLAELARVASTFGWAEAEKSGAVASTKQALKQDRLDAAAPAIDKSRQAYHDASARANALMTTTATAQRGIIAAAAVDIQVLGAKIAATGHAAAAQWRIAMASVGATVDIVGLKVTSLAGKLMTVMGHPLFMIATMVLTMMIPSMNKWLGVNTELFEKAAAGTKALNDSLDITSKSYSRLLGMATALSVAESKSLTNLVPLYEQKVAVANSLVEANMKIAESIQAIADLQKTVDKMTGPQRFFDGVLGLLPGVTSELNKLEKVKQKFNESAAQNIDSQLSGLDPAAAQAALDHAGLAGSAQSVVKSIREGTIDMNKLTLLSETLNVALKNSTASARQLAEGFREANTFADTMSSKIVEFGVKTQNMFKNLPDTLKPLGTAFENIFKFEGVKSSLEGAKKDALKNGKAAPEGIDIKIKEAENKVLIEQAKIFNQDIITALVTVKAISDEDAIAMRAFAQEIAEVSRASELFDALNKKLADLGANINAIIAKSSSISEAVTAITELVKSEFESFSTRIESLAKNSSGKAKEMYALETRLYALELVKRLKLARDAALEEARTKMRSSLISQDAVDMATGGAGRSTEAIEKDIEGFAKKWDTVITSGMSKSISSLNTQVQGTLTKLGDNKAFTIDLNVDPKMLDADIVALRSQVEEKLKVSQGNREAAEAAAKRGLSSSQLTKPGEKKGTGTDTGALDSLQRLLELEKARLDLNKAQTKQIESYGIYSQLAHDAEIKQAEAVLDVERRVAIEKEKNKKTEALGKLGKKGSKSEPAITAEYENNLKLIEKTFEVKKQELDLDNTKFNNLKREIDSRKNLLDIAKQEVEAELERRKGVTVSKIVTSNNPNFSSMKDTTDKYAKLKPVDENDLHNPSTAIDNAKASEAMLANQKEIFSLTNNIKSLQESSVQTYKDITLATQGIEQETKDLLSGKIQLSETELLMKDAILTKNIANAQGNVEALNSIHSQIAATGALIDATYVLAIAKANPAEKAAIEEQRKNAGLQISSALEYAAAAATAGRAQVTALKGQKTAVEGLIKSAAKLRNAFSFSDVLTKLGSNISKIGSIMTKAFPTKKMGGYVTALGAVSTSVGELGRIEGEVSKERTEMGNRHSQILNNMQKGTEAYTQQEEINKQEEMALNEKVYQRKVDATFGALDAISAAAGEESETAKFLHNLKIGFIIGEMVAEAVAATQSTGITEKKITEAGKETGANLIAGGSKMFSQGGWAGFAGVAAMLAVMAALGHRGGGGGGAKKPTLEDRTNEYGTTVNELGQRSVQGTAFTQDVVDRFDEPLVPYQMKMVSLLKDIVDNTKALGDLWKLKGATSGLGGSKEGASITVTKDGGYGRGDIASGSWNNLAFNAATKNGNTLKEQSSTDNQGTGILFGTSGQLQGIEDTFYKVDTSGSHDGSRNYANKTASGINEALKASEGFTLDQLTSGQVQTEVYGMAGDNSGNDRGTVVGSLQDKNARDFANIILGSFIQAAQKFKDILEDTQIMGSIGLSKDAIRQLDTNLSRVRIKNTGAITTSGEDGKAVSSDDIQRMVTAGQTSMADDILKQAFDPNNLSSISFRSIMSEGPIGRTRGRNRHNYSAEELELSDTYKELKAFSGKNGKAVSENFLNVLAAQSNSQSALAGTGITLTGDEWKTSIDEKSDPAKWGQQVTKAALLSSVGMGKLDSSLVNVIKTSSGTSEELVNLYNTFTEATNILDQFGITFTDSMLTGAGSVERLNAGLAIMSERMTASQNVAYTQAQMSNEMSALPANLSGLTSVDAAIEALQTLEALGEEAAEATSGQLIAALPAIQRYEDALKAQVTATTGLSESLIIEAVNAMADGSMTAEEAGKDLEKKMKQALLTAAIAEFARLAMMEVVSNKTTNIATTMATHAANLTDVFQDEAFLASIGTMATGITTAASAFIKLGDTAEDAADKIQDSLTNMFKDFKDRKDDRAAERSDRNDPNKAATRALLDRRVIEAEQALLRAKTDEDRLEALEKLATREEERLELELEILDTQIESANNTLKFYKDAEDYLTELTLGDKNLALTGKERLDSLKSTLLADAEIANATAGTLKADGTKYSEEEITAAQGRVRTNAEAYLDASMDYNASSMAYQTDFQLVQSLFAGWADKIPSQTSAVQSLEDSAAILANRLPASIEALGSTIEGLNMTGLIDALKAKFPDITPGMPDTTVPPTGSSVLNLTATDPNASTTASTVVIPSTTASTTATDTDQHGNVWNPDDMVWEPPTVQSTTSQLGFIDAATRLITDTVGLFSGIVGIQEQIGRAASASLEGGYLNTLSDPAILEDTVLNKLSEVTGATYDAGKLSEEQALQFNERLNSAAGDNNQLSNQELQDLLLTLITTQDQNTVKLIEAMKQNTEATILVGEVQTGAIQEVSTSMTRSTREVETFRRVSSNRELE